MKKVLGSLIMIIFVSSCNQQINKPKSSLNMEKTYLALGDSYTIGESVSQDQSFPFQLSARLKLNGVQTASPEIIATTGWTTDELIKAISEKNLKKKYDLVTLLIGVNNQYRGYSQENYRLEFKELLKTALLYADNQKERVIVISIPDWGVTPFAKKSGKDLEKISKQIDAFNAINKEEAVKLGVKYLNITKSSRNALTESTLIAEDGLHPSGKMYGEWAAGLVPLVLQKH